MRAAREDQATRVVLPDPLHRNVMADNLAKDILLPHAAGDKLGVLGAKIQHQHTLACHVRDDRFGFICQTTHPPIP